MSLPLSDVRFLGELPLFRLTQEKNVVVQPMVDDYYPGCSLALGNQAVQSGFWALARDCYHTGISHYGERSAMRYNLALCDMATGQPEKAMVQLTRARHLSSEGSCVDVKQQIEQRMAELAAIEKHWKCCSWFTPAIASSKHLSLEPLQERHLPALPGLIDNRTLTRRANLSPVLHDVEAKQWWPEWQQNTNYNLAVVHHDLGLMGLCGLGYIEGVVYFYIWLGYNNLQLSLATEAILLALRQISDAGVDNLCTAVLENDQVTRRTLSRAGFERLNGHGHSGGEAVVFYGCDLEQGRLLNSSLHLQGRMDMGF